MSSERENNSQRLDSKPKPKKSILKLPDLTYGTVGRIAGTAEAFVAVTILANIIAYGVESDSKIRTALSVLAIPILALIASDGIVDITKGTHHFLALKTWRLFSSKEHKKR